MNLRDLPSIDSLLQAEPAADLVHSFGRTLTLQALRQVLEEARQAFRAGGALPEQAALIASAAQQLEAWFFPTLRPLINATGVIIHTNLGRAPLANSALAAIAEIAAGYSNLEYDLASGSRGKRHLHAEDLLLRLTGAEAALVVNNNAAAVLLGLTALARRKDALISRSQLIEIGGGFRIPDVMKQSGARLIEVGTTNRTHLQDFSAVITDRTGVILRAHSSNFRIVGFTAEPEVSELVALGRQYGVPMFDDLGSGALLDTAAYGLGHEPTVQESIAAGAGLVAFSGDKLLGGPQAGILVGEADLISRLRRHPLARALRADKITLAALAATLRHYLVGDAVEQIPIWQMIAASEESTIQRAQGWATTLGIGEVLPVRSPVGGGSLPEATLAGAALALRVPSPNRFAARLRQAPIPLIARVEADQVIFDPRTVLAQQEPALIGAIQQVLAESDQGGI